MGKLNVYIVKDSGLEEYQIEAVFTDKTLAEEYIRVFGGEIDKWVSDQLWNTPPDKLWYACVDKDGKTITCYQLRDFTSVNRWKDLVEAPPQVYIRGYAGATSEAMYLYCLAANKERAERVANEARVRLIESGKWSPLNG